jgi:NAD(P)-dependent dehydrogenase (short-subunit alcohol dehydrogenase family)
MQPCGEKAVLITGASSGIGKASAVRLAREGFRVFAGVRRQESIESSGSENSGPIEPIVLDVTKQDQISEAVRLVADKVRDHGLYGLINNAGWGDPGPLEYVPLDDIRRQFEVNVFGPIAVTQAFLPLVRRAVGRIVNMGSVGDRITMPFGGALCASKSALASMTEALRLELRPWGIHVCLVEPGAISTPAVDKTASQGRKLLGSLPPEGARQYGPMFRAFLDRAMRHAREGSPPEVVASVVLEALSADKPKTRYPVGKNAKLLTRVARLPDAWLDRLRLRFFHLPAAFGDFAAHQ